MAEKDTAGGHAQGPSEPALVLIGASAGGLSALQTLFEELPSDTAAAYVVVVHLDPQHRSDLARILGTHTKMTVVQVDTTAKLVADHVYVIPPDRRLEVRDHEIFALRFDEPRGQRAPIDLLFRSVARRLGDGFAVILSGAGSDGALGVKAIKEAGGIILVQDPSEAEYSSMPRSAIETGVADFILPVTQLAHRLGELIASKQIAPIPDTPDLDEELVRRILAYLRVRTGHDFSKYKRSTVLRRIARRMQITRTNDLSEYHDHLREKADEAQALLSDLLISVTTFFRDSEAFDALRTQVVPRLFEDRDATEPIRVWVSGCATGEEAYSIAMLLLDEASRHESRPQIQVFGSDLDARALATAREGRYPASIEADVSEERLRRFFNREGDAYRVRQELRDIVLFAIHDLLKDPPFSRVDLISCRNVLIYLDRELQEQVCGTFHYALNPGGFLLLGSSETADNPPGLFRMMDRNTRIYQSTAHPGDKPRLLQRLFGPIGIREQSIQFARPVTPTAALNEAAAHRRAIERMAPPSVLVDETHRVMHLSENAGRFVAPSGGPLSGDVVDLVRPELRFELRSALHRAFEQRKTTLSLPIPVRFNGSPHRVHMLVAPAPKDDATEISKAVVMFIEGEPVEETLGRTEQRVTDETVRRLTQELELTQARLRTVREESEAANEELRAANEELQSINEEYRSTSEELETSKEELQSINEELQTVNSELKLKLEAISRAHSDLQNLVAASDYGTLFLDSGLRIKRFTDQVTELFSITPSDEGRPITDFAHRLEYDELGKDARGVLADLAPVRREIRSRHDRWYDVRMRPRTVDDKIDGVVITFVDVTDRRQVETALRDSERQLQQQKRLLELSPTPIFVWDFDGGVVEWNRGSEELYGFSRAEALGKTKEQLFGRTEPPFDELEAKLLESGSWNGEIRQRTKDGRQVIVESRMQLESFGDRRLVLESTLNITEHKNWEERQRTLLGELTHRVKNTLTVVMAIAHQTLRATPSPKEFAERFDGRLTALARSHDLLVQSGWNGADLTKLAQEQLEPYVGQRKERVRIHGDAIILSSELLTPFGLVIHELATNATKYGSLSVPEGKVELSWAIAPKKSRRMLEFVWREQGGPAVEAPTQSGLGTSLIDHGIPGATVNREFLPQGLRCTIRVPLDNRQSREKAAE
ncbi:MAG TPA: chemotaxis protein CheB [Alphaproteobacteria bacterium]|nr:chemotaxis protein CheB [Alphaproteobacteria bacterium]